jgi:hypothetical protein
MIKRTNEYYKQCEYTAIKTIEFLIELYKDPNASQQEIKRNINRTLRRFHDYNILERKDIILYYVDTSSEDTTVEHVIPVNIIADKLINGEITIKEALYTDICLLSKTNNKLLREAGLTNTHNNLNKPFSRYIDAGIDVSTIRDGNNTYISANSI